MAENQIVYVLTNPAMPGLVKIGKTTQLEVEDRMKQLYGTGVPFPFDCAFACRVKDAAEVEKALHKAFGKDRINLNREFFKLEPDCVIAILKLLKVEEMTLEFEKTIEADVSPVDKESAASFKRTKRPRMDFHELSIPNGSLLIWKEGNYQATVVDPKKVNYEGGISALIAPTRKILGLPSDYPLQPSPYWMFNGKNLKDIYEDYHGEEDI